MYTIFHKLFRTPAIKAGVLILLICLRNLFFAQGQGIIQNDLEHSVRIFDETGKTFVNPYIDITGSPFLFEELKTGIIRINDHRIFSNIPVKLNLVSQEVHFMQAGKGEMVLPAGLVRELIILDSSGYKPVIYTYQCGFPPVDNQSSTSFYQILSDGKIKFLKSLRKIIHQEKNEYSGEVQKEFREYEDYYFFVNNKMERIKREKSYILDMLKDKEGMIAEFLQKNKLSFKSIDDIKKLVDYYNTL